MFNQDQFEIIVNPGYERWIELIRLTHQDEGWIMARDDYKSWISGLGQENFRFYCAVDKKTNEIAGTVIHAVMPSVNGSPRLATAGMFYVRPQFRQTGLGSYLFKTMMDGEEDNNVSLNGVMDMTQKYAERHGFKNYSPWKEAIYRAKITDIDAGNLAASDSISIIDRSKLNWDDYLQFDAKILVGQNGAYNKFAVEDGIIVGVCNIRACYSDDLVLGSFYAKNKEIATALLKATVEAIHNLSNFKSIMMVTPDTNADSTELFHRLSDGKLELLGYMMSQFTKAPIPVDDKKVYSMTDYANNFI